MKSKKEVKTQLKNFESFGDNGKYTIRCFNECMGAIVLKEILEHYTTKKEVKKYIKEKLKENSKTFQQNKANMRGAADGLSIKHYLWVIDANIDDYFDKNDNFLKNEAEK
jgi:hypothetical protein